MHIYNYNYGSMSYVSKKTREALAIALAWYLHFVVPSGRMLVFDADAAIAEATLTLLTVAVRRL